MFVRPATPADADAIGAIHVGGWRAAYRGIMPNAYLDALDPGERAEQHRARIAAPEPGTTRWVAERDGRVVGFAVLGPAREPFADPSAGEVYAIYVHPDERATGVGRTLLEHSSEELRRAGYARAELWVLRDNAPARRFYEALGWRDEGSEKAFRLPGFEDVELPEVRYALHLER